MLTSGTSSHFVLVHGACHGAWCWYKLLPLIKSAGHCATALDLAASGVHPERHEEVSSLSDYLQPLMDFMASLPPDERVILIGHSYGGLAISLAMENFPQKIVVGVFVTAYMPNSVDPPASLMQEFFRRTRIEFLMDCHLTFEQGMEKPLTSIIFGPDFIAAKVYSHCPPEDVELAKMLVRPHRTFIEEFSKDSLLTTEKYGSVGRVYIFCEEDKIMEEDFQSYVMERSPYEEMKIIQGAGHMVMLSKPQELCLCLMEIANKYN